MTKTNASLSALKKLSRESPTGEEVVAIFHELQNDPNDRAVAIIAATLLEDAVGDVILSHMVWLSDEEYRQMFVGYSPLGSFSAKIQIAYAFGYYKKNVREALNIIKDIRNAFAHGKKSLSFNHEVIKNCCNLLTIFEESEESFEPGTKSINNSPRQRYLNHAMKFTEMCVQISAEEMLRKISDMGLGPDNYVPGDLRSIKIE